MRTLNTPSRISRVPAKQAGIALLMAIIMLIIATLAGIAGIRNSSLQEKLAGNLYDRAIALQAAEAALNAAETKIITTDRPTLLADTTIIDCTQSNTSCPSTPANTFTSDATGWTTISNATTTNQSLKAGTNPQYFIQYLGLKSSSAVTDTSQSANPLQYGSTGGGTASDSPQNATYRIIARSSQPTTATNNRSIALVSSLVKGN